MKAPTFIIRILALFDGDIKAILPSLGDTTGVSNKKAQSKLGMSFIPVDNSIIETAEFLIQNGR